MATTSLSSQLQRLAAPQTSILDQRRDCRSILFDPSEAGKFGRDVYYDIGWSGCEVLLATDPAFKPFATSLFGRASRDLQRAVETQEVNTWLDQEIERFLLLLCPYLEKEASLKALEWLVYRFQINDMNQQSLLKCIFPYYESPLFIRILQVMSLGAEGAEWHWLTACQKAGRPLPKRTIFTRWANSQAFRNFVTNFLKTTIKTHSAQYTPTIFASFYITTVLGGLHVAEVREEHLSSIVKGLPCCLASSQEQLLTGSYLLLSILASKSHLSLALTTTLLEALILKHPPPDAFIERCLLCLLVLAHHQPLEELPPLTAAALLGSPLLAGLTHVARDRSVAALLSPYVMGCVRYIFGEDQTAKKGEKKIIAAFTLFVDELFSLPLSDTDSGKVMWSLYEAVRTQLPALEEATPRLLEGLGAVVGRVEALQPHGYTEATTRLTHLQDHPQLGPQYKKVLRFLLLSDDCSSISFTQLLHPQKSLREEASKNYLKRLGQEELVGASAMLHISSMLSDDHPPVPLSVLSTPAALEALPTTTLVNQCCQLLYKRGKDWQKVKEASLIALSGASVVMRYDLKTKCRVLATSLPYVLLPRTSCDLVLSKIVLKSQLAKETAFLSVLKREAAPYLHDGGKARDYCDKIWSAMPRVVSGLGAEELLALCGVFEGSREGSAESQLLALALLHASLASPNVTGHLGLKMAHRLIDLCLTLLEGAKALREQQLSSPAKGKDSQAATNILSLEQLRTSLVVVRQGGAVPSFMYASCVLRVCAAFSLPTPCQTSPYWTPLSEGEPCEGQLLLLIKVVKAGLKLEAADNTAGRDAVLLTVFKECLPDPKHRFYLLAIIWGWQSSLPFTDIIDEALQVWTLVLGKALLSAQSSSLAWTLSTHEPLVPALLSALTSVEESVRLGAIECLRALFRVRGGALAAESYIEVVRMVLSQAEELVADASQLSSLLGGCDGPGASKVWQGTCCLLGVLDGEGKEVPLPSHLCASLLYTLSSANDTTILLRLLPMAESLLDKVDKVRQRQDKEGEARLDMSSSLCFLYILKRFTPKTADVLETEAGLRVFERAMESTKECLMVHGSPVAPQTVLLQEVLSSRFMGSIKSEVTVSRIWSMLVARVTSSRHAGEASRLRHALRHVTLDAQVIVNQINDLQLSPKVATPSLHAAQSKRIKMREANATHQEGWEKLQLMLETLTIMKSLQQPWALVGPLIYLLNLTLTLDLTSTTTTQQQILSTLLYLLDKSIEELGEAEVSKRVQINVEVIVACVRGSLSHDTHRRALLLLALCARVAPDAVLHNMMTIFTFMGTSLMRRDDAYTFEVIHHTIGSIVPTLMRQSSDSSNGVDVHLANVCQVFVDALPDLPHHRRLPLFSQLAATLQPDRNLWLLLALLANSHAMRGGGKACRGMGQAVSGGTRAGMEEEEEEKGALPHLIHFCLTLASQFSASTQLLACVHLMRLVTLLPDGKETAKALQLHHHQQQQQQQQQQEQAPELEELKHLGKDEKSIAKWLKEVKVGEVEMMEEWEAVSLCFSHAPRHTFHLKYTLTGLTAHLLASDKFVGKVLETEGHEVEVEGLQALCHQLLEVSLCLLHDVNFACDFHKDKPAGRFFTSLQRKVVEVVEHVVALLPPAALLRVSLALLSSSPVALVRCRAAELISAKLQPHLHYFRSEDTEALQDTLHTLCQGVASKGEPVESRQTFLYCLQLLTRHLSHSVKQERPTPSPSPGLHLVLDTALNVLCDEGEEVKVVTQALLVAAEAVAALQVAAVGCLSRLVPALMRMLTAATNTTTTTTIAAAATASASPTQLLAIVTALHKVIESLPQLLSPYLEEVIVKGCCIRASDTAAKQSLLAKESKVMTKLSAIRESLIKKVETRILVPKLVKAFHTLRRSHGDDLSAIHSLLMMVGCLLEELTPKTLLPHLPAMLALLTEALDLRTLQGDSSSRLEAVEQGVFSALSRLLLHLPEHDNVSIFTSFITWAGVPSATPTAATSVSKPARLISFYRFANHLAGTYQVLFVAAQLAHSLLHPTVSLLTLLTGTNTHLFGESKEAEEHIYTLLEAILNTLHKVFTNDSVGFVTPERFELLSVPLTNLLDGVAGVCVSRLLTCLKPCLVQLAVAGGDDALWRSLASQVLLRLREEDTPQVVLAALDIFQGLVETLGEDFLRPLLADAIPPISEALESTNPEIETATRTVFIKMEEILGDQLRSYLNY